MAEYPNGLVKTTTPSGSFGGVSVDNVRRTFGIGDKVAELAPAESIFFSYLSKIGKKPIDETVWKPLEYRNQWQRRNFKATQVYVSAGTLGTNATISDADDSNDGTHVAFEVDYNYQGKKLQSYTHLGDGAVAGSETEDDATGGYSPIFLTAGQILRINGIAYKLTANPTYHQNDGTNWDVTTEKGTKKGSLAIIPLANLVVVSSGSALAAHTSGAVSSYDGQVIGSQWGEATGAPDGFRDEISAVEFYSQIFKTAVPLMSGSTMATKYRGYANEWKRIYAEHIKAHKMDLENAFLFGYGKYTDQDTRNSWGMIPFLENKGGKRYSLDFSANDSDNAQSGVYDFKGDFTYDGVTNVMDDFMSYESGNSGQKLCLTSRKVINHLHKMDGGFVSNSLGSNNPLSTVFSANLDVKASSFMPIDVTSISTSWGSMNFVAHPLFRGDMEKKAVCIDLSNVSMRPLAGNGISRDTFVETNVQENDIDGRKDMIITEAGLEVLLPETHAVIDFVD